MRLLNVHTERLAEFKYKLICRFKLAADIVRGDIREKDFGQSTSIANESHNVS